MSDVTKFLKDDHARVRRALSDYQRTPTSFAAALNVCDVVAIHMKIERELIYPAIWDQLGAADEKVVGDTDDLLYQRMEAVANINPEDPTLQPKMTALSRALRDHTTASEQYVEPRLVARPDSLEMGAEAFRRWQQLFEENMPRTWRPMDRLANTGWGGGGSVANAGW